MKASIYIPLLCLSLTNGVLAHPLEAPSLKAPQLLTLVFHSADGQYSMRFPADGHEHLTNNATAVNYIDAPDFTAQKQCTFRTPGQAALVHGIDSRGLQQILVGPPQPVVGVTCSGTCIPTWAACVVQPNPNPSPVTSVPTGGGECCSGPCDGGRCLPWLSR